MLPLTPTKLGRYEIVDEIGKGAMGVVYLARDPLIGRLVALKTFRIGYSVKDQELEQFRVRFMREAQSAGILTHPNIVTIHDVVEGSEDGLAFIAMEYVRGTNLKLLLQDDKPLSLGFVADTIAQIGDALDYAHSNRVVHRDVKPANILITSDNKVKITDFGIARLDSSNLTQEGQLLGTPNYMAPEQIQGKEVDHRADLFSLGVVLYEMLTRHKPFQGENLTVVSHRIVYDHFTPPRDYVHQLPTGIEKILARALEKDPARRYQRAREMMDDLRRLVETVGSGDSLNETQILSSTMALPSSAAPLVPPPPAPPQAAKPSLLGRLRKPAPAPASMPDPGTGTQGSPVAPVFPAPSPVLPAILPAVPLPVAVASEEPPGPAVEEPPDPAVDLDVDLAVDLADTAEIPFPVLPPPPPSRPGLSMRWLLVGGGSAALALVLLYAGVLLWRGWSKPAPPPAAPAPVVAVQQGPTPEEKRVQIAALFDRANALMRKADFPAAIALYRQAEQIDPTREDLRKMREAAERLSQEVEGQQAIEANIRTARQLLTDKKYEQAANLARLTLSIDPKNVNAARVLAQAEQATRRAKRTGPAVPQGAARSGEEVASTTPVSSEAPPVASEPAPAEAANATVRVHFQSELEAVLIVSVNDREIARKEFARGGLFGRRKQEDFNFSATRELPRGDARVRVHVTPNGKKGEVKNFPVNLRGGSSHNLEIYLDKSGALTAQFN
jgi:serine/threonine protein kinase/tetratricopeptide (TPR) repeat protein